MTEENDTENGDVDGASIKKTMNNLPLKLQSSETSFRIQLLSELNVIVQPEYKDPESNVPAETIIKAICKILPSTVLPRYKDSASRQYVLKLIKSIIAGPYGATGFSSLLSAMRDHFSGWADVNFKPSPPNAKTAVMALDWTFAISKLGLGKDSLPSESELKKFLELQSVLVTVVYGSAPGNSSISRLATRVTLMLHDMWKITANVISEAIQNLEQSHKTLIYASYFINWLNDTKSQNDEVFTKFGAALKSQHIDILVKAIVSAKTKTHSHIILGIYPLLRRVNHEEFKDQLLPAMLKAMLRNPEVIITTIALMIGGLKIDMSNYARDLGKPFASQLHAKDDEIREEAVSAVASLAKQCSDPEAIKSLLSIIFGVLGGSEGKLSVNTHKISLIQAAGKLATNAVSSTPLVAPLCETATDYFIKILETEVHEGTLLITLESLGYWAERYRDGKLPTALLEWIPKGLALKSSTSSVRQAYLQCIKSAIDGADVASTCLQLTPTLLKVVENCMKQSTQISLVSEGAHALGCLVRLSEVDSPENASTYADVFKILSDSTVFTNDRFLAAAAPNTLSILACISEKMIGQDDQKIPNIKRWYLILILALTCPDSKTRKIAQVLLKKLGVSNLRRPNGTPILTLLQELEQFVFDFSKVTIVSENAIDNAGTPGELFASALSGSTSTQAPGAIFEIKSAFVIAMMKAVIGVVSKNKYESSDAASAALYSIMTCHHPAIVTTSGRSLWHNLVNKGLGINENKFIKAKWQNVISIINPYISSLEWIHHAAGVLAVKELAGKRGQDTLVPLIVDMAIERLKDNAIIHVSPDEYEIYLTKEGELYDKSVLANILNEANSQKATNIKRENKAYSYKEQMEDIALRKELEEKKRKEGKLVEPKLTPKQKEALDTHLEKESLIRRRLEEAIDKARPSIALLSAAVAECPKAFVEAVGGYPKPLLPSLFRGLQSPLLADYLIPIFRNLRHAAFDCSDGDEDETLSQIVASITLKVIGPASRSFEFDNRSTKNEDSLKCSLKDITKKLFQSSVPEKGKGILAVEQNMVLDGQDVVCPFTTPAFNYCFSLIKAAIRQNKNDEEVLEQVLQMITEHSLLRGDCLDQNDIDEASVGAIEIDELHPKYLPRADMFRLLVDIVAETEGTRIQQVAVAALTDVAEASSGQVGCAIASKEEFDILMGGLQMEIVSVRDACLRGLLKLVTALGTDEWIESNKMLEELKQNLCQRVWIAKFDQDSTENAKFAEQLWQKARLSGMIKGDQRLADDVLSDVVHPMTCIREASAEALAAILKSEEMKSNVNIILESLLETYTDKLEMTPPVLDSFGRVIQKQIDHWEPRSGVALALAKIAPHYGQSGNLVKTVTRVSTFFVQQGLGDRSEHVRKNMLDAAVVTVNLHGKVSAEALLPVFEEFMENAPKSEVYDNVRQSVVILMGSLAKHLDSTDPKVRPIMRQLIIALKTPSQQVQEAVANCLPPLVPAIKEEAPEIVSKLIATLLGDHVSYGERKGAAYGVAGIVKGLGILSLKQLDIMGKLTEAITDKKVANHREGALFAFEMLCNMLGRLFEPYIVHILPHLLLCFGDSIEHVRQAADDTAKAVMSKLSAHGVKLVLPALLNALEEDQWRTKTGSVELLGAMAFCAPKQLSSCLPSIVPKLIEVLGDSHHKVQNAGSQALKQIGKVIRNPEIQAIVPVLLRALQDPAKKTGICLQTLLDTKFVHFIDAPSLALIMPVVQRAFQDRSTETRKMAAQIIGNMYSLTDQKDLSPYLPGIIPGLKASLLDPVPEVRAVSARALGAMVKGMGESSFEELLPWLMATLTSEASSVDRSGAAQGLAEVVGGLGVEKMNALLPDILKTAERTDISPHVKDGYIMMFIYMPTVFPDEFTPYISQIISPILRALADENEFVRETAYKAGQRLVMTYADKAIMMLLPELERGLFDENWRIRHSSIQLLGDLLYKVSGVSGKMTTETASEDDNFGTEQSQKAITRTLGQERRNRVLAGLYMGRSDVALLVRQSALHVWKVIVSNTPKTLREILPTLFNLLLGCLASNSYDKRQIAARTLGDLVKKLGERVLPEIIPILEKGLASPQPEKRQGVCVGLSEIMISTSKDMVLSFVDSLVPTVRKALCDETPEVRLAAAKTFESLHNTVGSRALDDILPPMLAQITASKSDEDDEESLSIRENTLDGLRQVMAIKAKAVLPYLVPQLIAPPVNMKAIATVAPVAGDALHRHLSKIMPAMLQALADAHGDSALEADLQDHAQAVVLSVHDDEDEVGLSCIMDELLGACSHGQPSDGKQYFSYQRAAVTLLHLFCRDTKMDYSGYVPQLIRTIILIFTSDDSIILQEAWNALTAVTKTLDASQQMAHVSDVRQAVRFAVGDLKDKRNNQDSTNTEITLPGFCLPKGIQPILPIFRESILNGAPDLKEQAANGLAEVIALSNAEALKPSVVHITGPLIRILGDRFASNVKTAVLDTLASLLYKASILLKPFFPQLQTTFIKALNDTNRTVRLKAGIALSHLIVIHMRPDPLFNELANGIKGSADDTSVRDTYLQALRGCLEPAGDKMSAPIRRQILPQLLALTDNTGAAGSANVDDTSRIAAAGCLGAYLRWLPIEDADNITNNHILKIDDADLDWTVRHGRSTALFVALKEAPWRIFSGAQKSNVIQCILSYLAADRIPIVQNGVRSCAFLFIHCIAPKPPKHTRESDDDLSDEAPQAIPPELIVPFAKTLKHSSNDVKQLVAVVSSFVSKSIVDKRPTIDAGGLLPTDLLRVLLPLLVNGTKEKNSTVKSCSESALVNILRLRQKNENGVKECLQVLDGGARESLQDVITKVLQKVANQPEGKDDAIDDTLLV